jgi:phage baseplate assembly protein W
MALLTPNTRRREVYSDFPKDFAPIPGRSDLSRKINENSVRESIRNIVLTDPGERPFNPTFGCGIRRFLFENMDDTTAIIIKDTITDNVNAFEPRAEVVNVEVSADLNTNLVFISIVFRVINTEVNQRLDLQVSRIR